MVQGSVPLNVYKLNYNEKNLKTGDIIRERLSKEGYQWFKDFFIVNNGKYVEVQIYNSKLEDRIKEIIVEENL